MSTRAGPARLAAATLAGAAVLALAVAAGAGDSSLDPDLPLYRSAGGQLSGDLRSVGSDTMSTLMTLWAEGFARHHPRVRLRVEGSGSAAGAPALIAGTADLAPTIRAMTADEVRACEAALGHAPTRLRVSMDALAVFVHRDNPIGSLSLRQLDSAFSSSLERGGGPADTWDQLGLGGFHPGETIDLLGPGPSSDLYGFFRREVLQGGSYRDSVVECQAGSIVVAEVGEKRRALGHAGVGHASSRVRTVPVRACAGLTAYEPSYEHVAAGTYPLRRDFYVHVASAPGEPLAPLVREFFRFVYSREGQAVVVQAGYMPLDGPACARERTKLR